MDTLRLWEEIRNQYNRLYDIDERPIDYTEKIDLAIEWIDNFPDDYNELVDINEDIYAGNRECAALGYALEELGISTKPDFDGFMRAVHGSKQFSFDGSVLELVDYNTGDRFKIDLANIDEEMFQQLQPMIW